MSTFYAFDLETAALWQPGQHLDPRDGLGISCAAVCSVEGDVTFWWGGQRSGRPQDIQGYAAMGLVDQREQIEWLLKRHPEPAPRMSAGEVRSMLVNLVSLVGAEALYGWRMGGPLVTWNGLAFDLQVLAVESELLGGVVPDLAMSHVDLMFAFLSVQGYRLGLKAAAEGCGSTKGVEGATSGADAPQLWHQGDYVTALMYLAQDVIATRDVMRHVLDHGGFSWRAMSGRRCRVYFPAATLEKLTVARVREWPEPDTSWQSDPIDRHQSYAWMQE